LEKFEKLHLDYKTSRGEYDAVNNNIVNLKKDFKKRRRAWTTSLENAKADTNKQFKKYMAKKGFLGEIEFDDDSRELKLIANPDKNDSSSQHQDVRNLSGGERSYTTLSLLMALGHTIDCPFRLMDEYDVFLDEVTRSKTLTLLQDYALKAEQRKKQFIIITPHTLAGIDTRKDPDKVKIVKMQPPQRISAHGLQQQTLSFCAGSTSEDA
jgi:chromosome segregation ATPase